MKIQLLSCALLLSFSATLLPDCSCARLISPRSETPHIPVPAGAPGIVGLFATRPEAAKPMRELAEVLLRDNRGLSKGERELIAAFVSSLNKCTFCCNSHSAAAMHQLDDGQKVLEAVKQDYTTAPISEKLKALLVIAAKVQKDARTVTRDDVDFARKHGAIDLEIHDTVLIAAAFCMYNRYVDGLAATTPTDPAIYDTMGKILAAQGYLRPNRD